MQITLCDVCEKQIARSDSDPIEWQGQTFHPDFRIYDKKAPSSWRSADICRKCMVRMFVFIFEMSKVTDNEHKDA